MMMGRGEEAVEEEKKTLTRRGFADRNLMMMSMKGKMT